MNPFKMLLNAFRRPDDRSVSAMASYPSSTGSTPSDVETITKLTSSSVANANTLTVTITPSVAGSKYSIGSIFIDNIIGKACTVKVHVEVNVGEGALAGNVRDSKTYAGSETSGGYISGIVASTPCHITVLNSSGDALVYTLMITVLGGVSVSQSVA